MNLFKTSIASIFLFGIACFCSFMATHGVAENPSNLSDTTGVPAVMTYVAILLCIGFVAVLMASLGVLISTRIATASYKFKVIVFLLFNSVLVMTSLLGILILSGYTLDTFFSVLGGAIYVMVIALVVISVPRNV